ncbi:2Fe-2S iron-sulfur cluster-binding protein [Spirosoma foliorum]|uniref:nitric oxide dioxygenase n=1 Tax=Spirosoma foliorum TaxID=2710596 RepID=A0A7G5H1F1_9BACT|nr:2Fe-2S iron-sulfur cluster-binding protein [Spirosoma foliorum]QMW04943.1 2Fe-2S iron-sulfur cluster binding domain-containing protein [Spirosoma foliorum]
MFTPVQVIDKVRESQTIYSFYLKSLDEKPLAPYRPGQHVLVRLSLPGQVNPVLRSYILSTAPGQPHYRITVKREGNHTSPGIASAFLHDQVFPGDTLWISEPQGAFVLPTASRRPVVLVSAGVGITPMLSMLETIAQEPNPRSVWFFHGSRNNEVQPMSKLVRALACEHSHIQVFIHHSQPFEHEIIGEDYDTRGRIDLDFLKRHLPTADADFYLCGPGSFVNVLTEGLKLWGGTDAQLAYEYFGTDQSTAVPDQEINRIPSANVPNSLIRRVSLVRSNQSFVWNDTDGSILDLLESQNIFPPSSCRQGTCMSCSTSLLSGTIRYSPEPFAEPFEGEILICCAQPQTDIELDL